MAITDSFIAGLLWFQSHAGSIEAPGFPRRRPGAREPFQSHAGSIEAGEGVLQDRGDQIVSIPRWFD